MTAGRQTRPAQRYRACGIFLPIFIIGKICIYQSIDLEEVHSEIAVVYGSVAFGTFRCSGHVAVVALHAGFFHLCAAVFFISSRVTGFAFLYFWTQRYSGDFVAIMACWTSYACILMWTHQLGVELFVILYQAISGRYFFTSINHVALTA